jgi:hypothetical protein
LFFSFRHGTQEFKWDDVDFERGFIQIRDPKGGQDQKIPLNGKARELLQSHSKTDSPYVFPGRKGRKRVDINQQVNQIKEAAGLPKDFRALHGLRHVYASMLASSGQVDLYTLQKLLAHKSPVTTQRYANLRAELSERPLILPEESLSKLPSGFRPSGEDQGRRRNQTQSVRGSEPGVWIKEVGDRYPFGRGNPNY